MLKLIPPPISQNMDPIGVNFGLLKRIDLNNSDFISKDCQQFPRTTSYKYQQLSPHYPKVHFAWCKLSKSIPRDGAFMPSPSSDGAFKTTHANITNANVGHTLKRAARPPRGGAGESRLRPADTECAQPRLRNSARGIRSREAIARRKNDRKTARKHCRRMVRSMNNIGFTIPVLGREAQTTKNKQRIKMRNAFARSHWKTHHTSDWKPLARKINITNGAVHEQVHSEPTHTVKEQGEKREQKEIICKDPGNANEIGIKFKNIDKFRVCELNARGVNDSLKRQVIDRWGTRKRVDIICLSEVKVNSNCTMKTKHYTWYFSTSVDIKDKALVDNMKHERMPIGVELRLKTTEHHGVAIAVRNKLLPAMTQIVAINSRMMYAQLKGTVDTFIFSTYAPTSIDTPQIKDQFYNNLANVWKNIPEHNVKIICGDFNAKIITINGEDEQNTVGRHYLKGTDDDFQRTSNETLDNRQRFLNFLIETRTVICNTKFEKPVKKLCTHKPPATVRGLSDWTYNTFDQIDYILINKRFNNSCNNCESDPDAVVDSDHYPVWAEIVNRLKVPIAKSGEAAPDLDVTKEEKEDFNRCFRRIMRESANDEIPGHCRIDAAMQEARKLIRNKKSKPKRPWLTASTIELIEKKHQLEQTCQHEALRDMIKKIRKAKRKDWKNWVHSTITEDLDIRDKWMGIKFLKQKFSPALYERADMHGTTVEISQKATAAADYLAQKQWGATQEIAQEADNYYTVLRNIRNNIYELGEITRGELKATIKRMKKRKAVGPDDTPMEFFKWLDDRSMEEIRSILNEWWEAGTFPEEKLKANIASIYKKGNPKMQENYRPISLLNSIYKLYAAILQKRLAAGIDGDLQDTQYGFRPARSTATPVACIRRILDRAEESQDAVFVTFLDWEKAFDKVKQDKLIEALRRMNIPEKLVKAISSLYTNPQFRVKIKDQISGWRQQQTGIRQGCPLSPYLFIVLMTVLFRDVHDGLNINQQRATGLSFTELLYADDTALITTTAPSMNKLVQKIDRCAAYFGLKFNYNKCVAMNYNTNMSTKFGNGMKIPTADDTPYLGVQVRKDHAVRKEVAKKISSCYAVLQRLQLFWNNRQCPAKFRLQVHDAVIRSKLVYGLESTMLTPTLLNKLDVLQLKGIRKILNIKTTFVERANTNERVFQQANQIKNPRGDPDKNMASFSTYVRKRKHALLAHTIRAGNADPLRESTLQPDSAVPVAVRKRRVGRPRDHWVWTGLEDLYVLNNLGTKEQFRANKTRGAERVRQKALDRNIIL